METKICKECGRELPIDEFYKKSNKKFRIAICKDCISKRRKEYYKKNRNTILDRQNKYYQEHKQEYTRRSIEWQRKNWDKIKDKNKWKTKRRRNAQGSYTIEQWNECIKFFGGVCAYSSEEFGEDVSEKITVEHIIPISKNGTNFIWNIIPVKFKYNSSRNNELLKKWYKKQPFYSEKRLDLIRQWKKYARKKWGV